MRGRFVTFEGVEGAGKTTQLRLLTEHLISRGERPVVLREPGGTSAGEVIRNLLLNPSSCLTAEAELFLFLAARAQNTALVIQPALEKGQWVLCDRYSDSTIAYQGYGRNLDLATVKEMNRLATNGLEPDLTFVLDLPPEVGLARQASRNRMEGEPLPFHERVRKGYLTEAGSAPQRFRVLDACQDITRIHEQVLTELQRRGWLP